MGAEFSFTNKQRASCGKGYVTDANPSTSLQQGWQRPFGQRQLWPTPPFPVGLITRRLFERPLAQGVHPSVLCEDQ